MVLRDGRAVRYYSIVYAPSSETPKFRQSSVRPKVFFVLCVALPFDRLFAAAAPKAPKTNTLLFSSLVYLYCVRTCIQYRFFFFSLSTMFAFLKKIPHSTVRHAPHHALLHYCVAIWHFGTHTVVTQELSKNSRALIHEQPERPNAVRRYSSIIVHMRLCPMSMSGPFPFFLLID